MSRVGALSECPFQGDESIHSAGNGRPCSAPSTGGWPWFPHACYVSYGTLGGHHKEHRLVRRGHSTTSCRGSFYLCPMADSPMHTGAPVHVVARNNHAREGEGCDLEGHGASRACPAVCCVGMAGGILVLHRGNLFLGGFSVPRAHPGRGRAGSPGCVLAKAVFNKILSSSLQ